MAADPTTSVSERTASPEPASTATLTAAEALNFKETAEGVAAAVNQFIQGKHDLVSLALVCLLAEGHLLLEDVPGVGKTSLARSLAGALGTSTQRIQFTPDLLPGDVTGVSVFHQDSSSFVFHPGPIFANVVIADEINRASPRTQSALLEVMEERTVTVDGHPHRVPRPFMVVATQNPVEMDGTYPLPEAQLDRFLVRARVGYPDRGAEVRILAAEHDGLGVDGVPQVSSADDVRAMITTARRTYVAPVVMEYIVDLVAHTRTMPELRLGASPRGAVALLRTSRVLAALQGRHYVVPSDVQALAEPVLAHRLLVAAASEASGETSEDAVRRALEAVPAPPGDPPS